MSAKRLVAAIELEAAGAGLRTAVRAGRATRAHRQRLHDAEAAWDTASGRTAPRPRGRS